jgi:hypothetical protein
MVHKPCTCSSSDYKYQETWHQQSRAGGCNCRAAAACHCPLACLPSVSSSCSRASYKNPVHAACVKMAQHQTPWCGAWLRQPRPASQKSFQTPSHHLTHHVTPNPERAARHNICNRPTAVTAPLSTVTAVSAQQAAQPPACTQATSSVTSKQLSIPASIMQPCFKHPSCRPTASPNPPSMG